MTISGLLEEQARTLGEKTFIIADDTHYSYEFVHRQATNVAMNLQARGVGPGDKTLLLMGNCIEFVYVFLGAGRIGAVIVPINPQLKPDEIVYIASNADADTLITIPEFAPLLEKLRERLPNLKRLFVTGHSAPEGSEPFSVLQRDGIVPQPVAASPNDDAALIYTSGTTGLPKGVILTHRNYLSNARMIAHAIAMAPDDRFFCILPLFHVNAQVVTIIAPLSLGADVLLMCKFNPFAVLPMIEKHRATILSAVPTIYNIMCSVPKASQFDISSIKFFASGAAPMPEETYRLTQKVLKKPLIMGYGLSEATCASAGADFRDPIKWNSVGSPMRYTTIRIIGDDGVDLPYGEIGQIVIGGPSLMKGYYKNPQATAEVLRDGWLHTGDLGHFDEDGYLYIDGRIKDMIISGGQNIYPQEIENVISRLAGVEECAVVGLDEIRRGQEVLATVKRAEGATLCERDIIDHCRERLAVYKCPRFIRFVDALPKTATGKIKKNEIIALFAHLTKE